MAHLVTGYAGYEHIKSADDRAFNAAFFGGGQYVMESGNQFEGSIIDNNTVRILDGDLLMYGGHVRIDPDTYEDLTIETGTAGTNRIDLICMTYEKDVSNGTEKSYLQVVKGVQTEGTATTPSYTDGNILEGATFNQMPLYKVEIEGVVLKEITPLFITIPTYKTLAEQYAAQFEATINALKSANILDSMEEIEANTQEKMIAGALAVKEGFETVNSNLSLQYDATCLNYIEEIINPLVSISVYASKNLIKINATLQIQTPSNGNITILKLKEGCRPKSSVFGFASCYASNEDTNPIAGNVAVLTTGDLILSRSGSKRYAVFSIDIPLE